MGEQPMKKIRRWMAALLIFTMVLSGNILVVHGEIPSATKEFYVNDYAGVFSDSWKETLCEAGKQLHDDTTAQLVVLTVDSTDGEDISDYADKTIKLQDACDLEFSFNVAVTMSGETYDQSSTYPITCIKYKGNWYLYE